jgi:hypothetical protein
MSATPPLTPLNAEARLDQLFPILTSEQLARISKQGTRRELQAGQVVYEAGAEEVPFVVVIAGQLQTVRPAERQRGPPARGQRDSPPIGTPRGVSPPA